MQRTRRMRNGMERATHSPLNHRLYGPSVEPPSYHVVGKNPPDTATSHIVRRKTKIKLLSCHNKTKIEPTATQELPRIKPFPKLGDAVDFIES